MTTNKFFTGLGVILASAAGSSVAVFSLFNSLLTDLAPPFEDSGIAVEYATFGTSIVLLTLTIIIRNTLTTIQAKWIAVASLLLFALSISVYFPFRTLTRTYVYRYPDASKSYAGQTLHIRGELHDKGQILVGNKTIASTVHKFGGPDEVNGNGLLWKESSRLNIISRIEQHYIALVMLLTTALFTLGLVVWRKRLEVLK